MHKSSFAHSSNLKEVNSFIYPPLEQIVGYNCQQNKFNLYKEVRINLGGQKTILETADMEHRCLGIDQFGTCAVLGDTFIQIATKSG